MLKKALVWLKIEVEREGAINPSITAYDDSFRTLLNDCAKLVIPVVNKALGESYTRTEETIFSPNEYSRSNGASPGGDVYTSIYAAHPRIGTWLGNVTKKSTESKAPLLECFQSDRGARRYEIFRSQLIMQM